MSIRYNRFFSFPAIALPALCLLSGEAAAQACVEPAGTLFRTVTLVPNAGDVADVSTGNHGPVGIAVTPDERVFVIKMKSGQVRVYVPGVSSNNTILAGTIPTTFSREDGLLGIALDPDFAATKWLYLFYSDPCGTNCANRAMELARFTYNPGQPANSQLTHKKVILRFPRDTDNHHAAGGMDMDRSGTLVIGTGDNTVASTGAGHGGYGATHWPTAIHDAQRSAGNTNDLRGKVLRVRPLRFADDQTPAPGEGTTYTVPAGNLHEKISDPAFNPRWNASEDSLSRVRREIYAMGARNPYHPRVDNQSGWIFWGDVGPDAGSADTTDGEPRGPMGHDEWNLATGPGFFGWPYCNGKNQAYNSKTWPGSAYGTRYDCNATGSGSFTPMRNASPHNTGIRNLPRAVPAVVAYANGDNTGTGAASGDSRFGSGGESAISGHMYRYNPNLASTTKFPPYYEGKILFFEWARRVFRWLVINPDGTLPSTSAAVRSFSPSGLNAGSYIDAAFGPKGDLYLLRFSDNGYNGQGTSGLYRIEYTGTYDNACHQPFTATVGTPVPSGLPNQPVPPTVSYAGGPYTFPLGLPIENLRPVKGGGPVASFSISPSTLTALTGLQFNTSTGILSGTPSVVAAGEVFEVTAHGLGGTSGVTTVTLTTQGLAPTVAYAGGPYTFPLGLPIENLRPVKGGGPVTSFSIDKNLTALTGLQFNTATGILSGTPTVLAAGEVFQVTAHGIGGTTGTTHVTITTQGPTPTAAYPGTPYTFHLGIPIEPLRPVKGPVPITSFSIDKNLTALTGLQFNTSTGILSGTPTVPASAEAFQVTAHGPAGSTGATNVTITTQGLAPTVSYTDGGVYDFPLGATITNLRPIKGGGPITGYTIQPANLTVKTGLQFNTATGILSGKPTVPADAEAFTITALGLGGTSGATDVSISTHSTGKAGAGGPLVFRVSGSAMSYAFRVGEGGQGGEVESVTLRIADMSGRTVWSRTVHPSKDGARSIAWDGKAQGGTPAPAGMYIVSVSSKVDGKSSRVVRKTVTLDAN